MSQAAMAQAVRDAIKTAFGVDANGCEIGFDGTPPPNAGQVFYRVHPGRWSAGPTGDYDLDENIGVQVTVTMRLGTTPQDRYGVAVWLKTNGLEATCRKIVALIHMNEAVRNAATTYIQQTESNYSDYFHRDLEFLDGATPVLRGPEWFTAIADSSQTGTVADMGVSQTLTFGGAKRTQGVDNGLA